jgi:hypothetical protein
MDQGFLLSQTTKPERESGRLWRILENSPARESGLFSNTMKVQRGEMAFTQGLSW